MFGNCVWKVLRTETVDFRLSKLFWEKCFDRLWSQASVEKALRRSFGIRSRDQRLFLEFCQRRDKAAVKSGHTRSKTAELKRSISLSGRRRIRWKVNVHVLFRIRLDEFPVGVVGKRCDQFRGRASAERNGFFTHKAKTEFLMPKERCQSESDTFPPGGQKTFPLLSRGFSFYVHLKSARRLGSVSKLVWGVGGLYRGTGLIDCEFFFVPSLFFSKSERGTHMVVFGTF